MRAKRKKSHPKTTRRRTVKREPRKFNYNWSTFDKLARDRQGWRSIAGMIGSKQVSKVVDEHFQWFYNFTYLFPFFAGTTFPTKTLATIS